MKPEGRRRVQLRAQMRINHRPEAVFPLLCPVREYDWIEVWSCELVYSACGLAEEGCVFRTSFPDNPPETWIVTRHDQNERIHFALFDGNVVKHYRVELSPEASGTRLSWEQDWTGLDAEGDLRCAAADPSAFRQMISQLERMLEYYLRTGKRLPYSTLTKRSL